MILLAILLLFAPLIYHLVNDKDGERPEEKSTDILIVVAIACVAAVAGFLIAGKSIIDGLLLAWAIHFFAFDHLINNILYRRGVIENSDWFGYLGNSPIDKLMKKFKPWPRFWVRLGALIVAIVIYAIN